MENWVRNSIAEEDAAREQEAARRAAAKRKAYEEAYPEESRIWGWCVFIGIVLFGLLMAWGHYGPIVRDAIYGVGS